MGRRGYCQFILRVYIEIDFRSDPKPPRNIYFGLKSISLVNLQSFSAVFIQISLVVHEYFPRKYFKYIALLVIIGIVLKLLVHLIKSIISPKKDWLIKQYQEAYDKCLCPVCGKPLTLGVLHRVEELADRKGGYKPGNAVPFKSLMPLSEIIAAVLGTGQLYSKKVWDVYNRLVKAFGSEFNVLFNAPFERIEDVTDGKVARAVLKVREEKVDIQPGFDGEYGCPLLREGAKKMAMAEKMMERQKSLVDFG